MATFSHLGLTGPYLLLSALFWFFFFFLKLFLLLLYLFFFLMWTIFKVFIELITILFLFYVLVFWLEGMWDLMSPTRD